MRGAGLGWGLTLVLFASAGRADDVQDAKVHFQRARELYQSGSYQEARRELEAARDLDPSAKDLVFNLGIVCEKLDKIDDAIRYFKIYSSMDLDPGERARAESTLKRLEGVKRARPANTDAPPPPPPKTIIVREQAPPIGRVDGWTIGAASLGLAGLGVGAVFGILALTSRPSSGFVTGRDGSYQQLKDKADGAHTLAVVSDVGLISGAVFTVLAGVLFFARRAPVQRGANTVTVSLGAASAALEGTF